MLQVLCISPRPKSNGYKLLKMEESTTTVVIDSREQLPLDLAPLRTITGTLTTGDYSILGLEHVVAVHLPLAT